MNNKILPILLLTLFSSVTTQQVLANSSMTEETMSEPSAVENMMQQTQQMGDVVVLPAKEMLPGETIEIKVLDTPRRGMSMEKVRNELGAPISTSDSVGQPPITSWSYADRVVFFEYSSVIHVVSK